MPAQGRLHLGGDGLPSEGGGKQRANFARDPVRAPL